MEEPPVPEWRTILSGAWQFYLNAWCVLAPAIWKYVPLSWLCNWSFLINHMRKISRFKTFGKVLIYKSPSMTFRPQTLHSAVETGLAWVTDQIPLSLVKRDMYSDFWRASEYYTIAAWENKQQCAQREFQQEFHLDLCHFLQPSGNSGQPSTPCFVWRGSLMIDATVCVASLCAEAPRTGHALGIVIWKNACWEKYRPQNYRSADERAPVTCDASNVMFSMSCPPTFPVNLTLTFMTTHSTEECR